MNPLQDLRDIHTPAAIENWPPAYGWWLVAALVLFGLVILTIWLVKFRKVRLAKRQALKTLKQIDGSASNSASQLNQLLKRVAMTYFPQQNVQKMYGSTWINFLAKTLPSKQEKAFSEPFESLQHSLYQAHRSENLEYSNYYKSAETWIKHALPPSKKTILKLEQNDA
jgi:hypothetical protein